MIDKIKVGLVGCIVITLMTGVAMAFSGNTIKDIKAINKELTKIEVDVYTATQKKATREAEIKRLSEEVELINNHISVRESESKSLEEQKKMVMSGEVFIQPKK